ncbi:P-loop containing nucleoside triphosphate hydrolase protein [Fragilariopsis cylindrus CCMP1102]|uniref:p-loop containing nucleoside triphosphate hydrolase protein n=1 Tax=Fragilariopsis cylindrus CCMP1102 TaxID=635003 RepID=A0A1E7FQX9_9STRA|nr:P-loop containing nucleoside triphosphate hydrolase protein [Fragilariopsis cylindrus CCMP1102]|eukprot:OEU20558.1 P-loop containing nucleoside triphosphate hydrolase protein [Fragilariopsis cylindrus CCMP1102]
MRLIRSKVLNFHSSFSIYRRFLGESSSNNVVLLPRWSTASAFLETKSQQRYQSSSAREDESIIEDYYDGDINISINNSNIKTKIKRLNHIRNVGVLAHVDAGKTTVTERMLALAGVVRSAGSVDDGNTVTDFLPAERERGITIQSAAISFEWGWHNNNNSNNNNNNHNNNVSIQLIDTPGHVDFSVEVNRSVAVLDGAVLVLDAVAGVQAQTETVWRAIKRPSLNNHVVRDANDQLTHEPLPCLALINKMDKEGCHYGRAIQSIRDKLPGANPIPIQIPLFLIGDFVGVIDLIHMRAIIWPDTNGIGVDVENYAIKARFEFIEALAEVDAAVEECYLNDQEPSNEYLRSALRRATLAQKAVPVMAGAALSGKGLEPLLDSIADFLPSPLDRLPPALHEEGKNDKVATTNGPLSTEESKKITLGHPLHESLLALAFKVVHMKGRGSGDGRVVFARVYSGKLRDRDQLQVITPPALGEAGAESRTERIGGMLELAGGRFDNVEGGVVESGEVCALVGLKTVVTGDTLMLTSESSSSQKEKKGHKKSGPDLVYLAGVASPKPVITVRLESETTQEQTRLSEALKLMVTEDPSLVVEESESATLISGLGELHIEVTLDRLYREHGLQVMVGPPSVAYRETVKKEIETPGGLLEYDRTIGGTRLQAAVHLVLKPNHHGDEDELMVKSNLARALIQGCQGALKRGFLKSAEMTNVVCHIIDVDAEGGVSALNALPGALQAASANAVKVCLKHNESHCSVLEPTVSMEILVPNDMVGSVLSDLNNRRGIIEDVIVGDGIHSKSLVRGDVPLVEILGYATSLRSLTGGEGVFTSEYRGHSFC